MNLNGRSITKGDKEDYVLAVREFVEGIPSKCSTVNSVGSGATYVNGQSVLSSGINTATSLTMPVKPNLIVASRKKEIPIRVLDRTNDVVYYIDIQEGTETRPEGGPECADADSINNPKNMVSMVYVTLTALDSSDFLRIKNSYEYGVREKIDSTFPKLLPGMFIIEK